ncbi:MAG: nucleoside triphosphate pyrophosphohydrolase [Steroidobacteraceae bacterium]
MNDSAPPHDMQRLIDLMATLRHPDRGCPWDKEQTFASIAPYTLEEAYEVADAIERADAPALKEELGDLLFQVVFHARMAEEQGSFAFGDVVQGICDKMENRHPHVFGTERIATAEQQTVAWEAHKKRERAVKQATGQTAMQPSVLDNVPVSLPALTRAAKLGKRAATVGFEWPDVQGALDKAEEELHEARAAIAAGISQTDIEDELGDLLFCLVNICRHMKVDPETALRKTNLKFERRFRHVETRLREQGRELTEATLAEMDGYWDEAKRIERG